MKSEREEGSADLEAPAPLKKAWSTGSLSLGPAAQSAEVLQCAMDSACQAAMAGNLPALQEAFKMAQVLPGFTVNSKGSRGRTPLYQGCLGRQPHVVKWLLEQGAADNETGDAYICICAAGRGTIDDPNPAEKTAALMRQYGFNGKKKNSKGRAKRKGKGCATPRKVKPADTMASALSALASGNSSHLLKKSPGKNGELPIHFAAKTKNVGAVRKMLSVGDAATQKQLLTPGGKTGKLPLHYAVCSRDRATVEALLAGSTGSEVQYAEQLLQTDKLGNIPIHYALRSGRTEVALALLGAQNKVSAEAVPVAQKQLLVPDKDSGELPLHTAAQSDDDQLVQAILHLGEESDTTVPMPLQAKQLQSADNSGSLPIHHAIRRRRRPTIHALNKAERQTLPRMLPELNLSQWSVVDHKGCLPVDYALEQIDKAERNADELLAQCSAKDEAQEVAVTKLQELEDSFKGQVSAMRDHHREQISTKDVEVINAIACGIAAAAAVYAQGSRALKVSCCWQSSIPDQQKTSSEPIESLPQNPSIICQETPTGYLKAPWAEEGVPNSAFVEMCSARVQHLHEARKLGHDTADSWHTALMRASVMQNHARRVASLAAAVSDLVRKC